MRHTAHSQATKDTKEKKRKEKKRKEKKRKEKRSARPMSFFLVLFFVRHIPYGSLLHLPSVRPSLVLSCHPT